MQSNAPPPITSQMAELGTALIASVLAVMENPKAAGAALQAKLDAEKLTEEELAEAREARELISQAKDLRAELQAKLDDVETREDKLRDGNTRLTAMQSAHSTNVDMLNAQQKKLNLRDAESQAREARCGEREVDNERVRTDNENEAARLRGLRGVLQQQKETLAGVTKTVGDSLSSAKAG